MQIKNAHIVRQEGPTFIAMNHPNAFMDPITFSWFLFYPRTRYMARGDAFKKGLARMALQSMGIVPIFRLRDGGIEKVKQNLESFEIAYKLLDKRQKIMVFVEGFCIQERRLRNLQKGVAKMSLNYLEKGKHEDLKIVPIGINYSTPSKKRGDIFFEVGEPIVVKEYFEEYKTQPGHAINRLTAAVHEKLGELVPSLEHKDNDELIEQLQPILKKQYIEHHKLDFDNLDHQQQYWRFIIDRLNTLTEKDPTQISELRNCASEYTKQLEGLKITDEVLVASENKKGFWNPLNVVLLVLGFPFYLIGKILNWAPYYIGEQIAKKKVKGVEFYSSIYFGASALCAKLFFGIELLIVWLLSHNFYYLLLYTVVKVAMGIFGLAYSPFKNRILAAFRLTHVKRSNGNMYQSLVNQRAQILAFIGDF
ncbi:MAG: 1-acyl-sn-glycerol-3-phosphate acyltransferase [Bacteroidia bacterium]